MNSPLDSPTQKNALIAPEIVLLSYDKIIEGDNPRTVMEKEPLEELKRSILETPTGLIQPITVRPQGQQYELVAGARRRRAMYELHEAFPKDPRFARVPAIVREVDDVALPIVQLVENLHRADLTPIEVADAVARAFEDKKISEEDLARQLGWSERTLKKYQQLYRAPGWLKELGKQVKIPKKRLDENGAPVIDEKTGKAHVDHDRFPGLQFTFLMELVALHSKLAKWDKQRLDEDGSHKQRAQPLTERLAFSCAREGWGFARLQEEARKAFDHATGQKPAGPPSPTNGKAPFFSSTERFSIDLSRKADLTDTQKQELAAKATDAFKSLGFKTVIISLS